MNSKLSRRLQMQLGHKKNIKMAVNDGLLCKYVYHMSPVKRICVFEHSVMTNFILGMPSQSEGPGIWLSV